MTNKNVEVYLNTNSGILCLTSLIVGTMVYVYDGVGALKAQYVYAIPELMIELPECGMYVLVMNYSNCTPIVRRIDYKKEEL